VARTIPLIDAVYEHFIVPGGTINFQNIQNPIVDFIVSNNPNGKDGALNDLAPDIRECAISWCVKTMQTSSVYGQYTDKIMNTSQLNTNDAALPWIHDGGIYFPQFNLTLPDAYANGGQTTYGSGNLSTRSVIEAFQDFMPASWGILNNGTKNDLEVKYDWEYGWENAPPSQFVVPNTTWNGANLTERIGGLADSMTNIIRQLTINDSGLLENVPGIAYTTEVQVELRLQWAALPGGLLLFSLIFLLSTVWRTTDADKVGIWKTSALAMLFNGIGDDIQSTLGNKVRTGDARTRAKDMMVQLDDE